MWIRGERTLLRTSSLLAAAGRRIIPHRGHCVSDVERASTPPEQFERELLDLGLSGRCFGSTEYAEALGGYLGVRIMIQYLDDEADPVFRRRLALSGMLAECHYFESKRLVAVLVPASLPTLVREFTVFHELAHVAAGDLTRSAGGERLAAVAPTTDGDEREEEANARAAHILVAGKLGPSNPYARALLEVP